jgi:hypothetical protein
MPRGNTKAAGLRKQDSPDKSRESHGVFEESPDKSKDSHHGFRESANKGMDARRNLRQSFQPSEESLQAIRESPCVAGDAPFASIPPLHLLSRNIISCLDPSSNL